MPSVEHVAAIGDGELATLFSDFENFRRVILAVSGGPDSTGLMLLAKRWREKRPRGPELVAATIDHRLRSESKAEAAAVAKLAKKLGLRHRALVWSGKKPKTGLQQAAREARYRLLVGLAQKLKADAIATAHTLDDQAETVLMRLARGSGLSGLAGIRRRSEREGIALARPFLELPKTRLLATLKKAGIAFAEDPTNRDPRFARPRLRKIASVLAEEGLDAARLSGLAKRFARADTALAATVDAAEAHVLLSGSADGRTTDFNAAALFTFPSEITIRLLGRAIDRIGDEGPVELGKLESLYDALGDSYAAGRRLKRTLAGAAITLMGPRLSVSRAPARRSRRSR
ncbi:MAG TPA: tRNA lysidine(34) synthetase TilS [Xanthobacteraceae bacterium]